MAAAFLSPATLRFFALCLVTLGVPGTVRAEDAKTQAEQAMHDAQATGNPYVVEAVRQQLIKDHPELHDWLMGATATEHAPAGKVNAYAVPTNPPSSAPTPPTQGVHYKGEIQGGLELDSGNTQGSSFNSKASVTRDSEDWLYLGQASAAIDNDGHVTTKETYRALAQANYKLEPDQRLMTTFLWTSDRFTGFRDRYEEVSGLSNDWQLPDKIKLTTELAAGARELELTEGQDFDEPILWLRGNLIWPFAERWTFSEDLRDSAGTRYTFIWSDTSFTMQMDKDWKLRFALETDYNNNPPAGRKAVDTNTLVNLVYGF